MKWTVSLPRVVSEDDKVSTEVEADSIEEAISAAAPYLHDYSGALPKLGQVYLVSARVEVVRRPSLPLKSV